MIVFSDQFRFFCIALYFVIGHKWKEKNPKIRVMHIYIVEKIQLTSFNYMEHLLYLKNPCNIY